MQSTNKKKNRSPRGAFNLAGIALMMGLVSSSLAAQSNCDQRVASLVPNKPSEALTKSAQEALNALGYTSGEIDGVLGSKTKIALQAFCERAQFAATEDLLTTVQNHAALQSAYPAWAATLASEAFTAWAGQQPDAAQIAQIVASGNSSQVLEVIARFLKREAPPSTLPPAQPQAQAPTQPPAPTISLTVIEEPIYSYSLTKEDLAKLKSREAIFKQIATLQGESFPDKKAFDQALAALLKDVIEPQNYLELVGKYVVQQTSYTLTEESFNEVRVAGLPKHVLQAFEDLKGLRFPADNNHPGNERLALAVRANAGQLTDRIKQFKPKIVALVGDSAPTRLTAQALDGWGAPEADLLANAVRERLQKISETNVEYRNKDSFAKAIDNVLKQMSTQVETATTLIVNSAKTTTTYSLDEGAINNINGQMKEFTIPESLLAPMAKLQGTEYLEPDLFWFAIKAQIDAAEKEKGQVAGAVATTGTAGGSGLTPVAIQTGASSPQSEEHAAGKLNLMLEQYKPLILAQARKSHPFDEKKSIQWNGSSCGCVHTNLSGQVYGFYPHWLAGEKQSIDFSVLSRIGYYGFAFDDKGNIINSDRWSNQNPDFIDEARRYGSKIDLVIYRNDWTTWNRQSVAVRAAAFKNLAANIVAQLRVPMTGLVSKAKAHEAMGQSKSPIRGDGVTLYFSGYPKDEESAATFMAFTRDLSEQLKHDSHKLNMNIVFRSSELGQGVYTYPRLLELMDVIEAANYGYGGSFLVLLQEWTQEDKKRLRKTVEDNLRGRDMMRLLRNMVPVITYDGHSQQQLINDTIYAADNFGGIGFWPQPLAVGDSSAAMESVAKVLNDNFLEPDYYGIVNIPNVCSIVCPNRWMFHFVFDGLAIFLLGSIVVYARACSYRAFFDAKFLYFIALVVVPFLLVGMALLFCAPGLAALSRGNSLLIVMAAGIVTYAVWRYRADKEKANLP